MQQNEQNKMPNVSESNLNRIQQLWLMQKEISQKLQSQKINEKSIILIGDTNVGKTTLLYYLSGMKLNLVQNTAKMTKQMQPQIVYMNAQVSNSNSTTEVPNMFSQIDELPEISLIDMPGLNDKRFMNVLSNMLTFSEVFEKISKLTKIHIAFVISQEILDSQQIKENLQQFVNRFNVQAFKKAKNISVIFTKTEDDQQTVKQKFIEIIQQIKQELQDDEDEKDVVQLIDLIKELNQTQETMFIFPKQDPDQNQGLEIANSILQRDSFLDINQQSLHLNFIDNALLKENSKISTFQDNLIEVIQQSYLQINTIIDLSIGFTKSFHKKFVPQLFQSEEHFKTQLQIQQQMFEHYVIEPSKKNSDDDFLNSMNFICQNISETKEFYHLNKVFKDIFTQNCQNQQNNDENEHILHFTSHELKHLKTFFDKIQIILSNFKETQRLKSGIKTITDFLNWLCQKWFSKLQNTKSLEKIKDLLQEKQKQLQKKITEKWASICEETIFIDSLNKFCQKAEQYQSGSESEQMQKIQEHVPDNGYYGNSVKQLKQKYMKVSQVPKLDESKTEAQIILNEQTKLQDQVRKLVLKLESQLIIEVDKAQQSGRYKISLNPQKIALILFQMRKLRHRIFLQSAVKNFGYYLKFMHYSLVLDSEKQRLMDITKGFVQNLCMILDQYALFEEEILFKIFVHDFSKISNIFKRGIRMGRIGQNFIKDQLICHFKTLIQKISIIEDLQQLSEVIITVYNYLIAEYSFSRSQISQYENEKTATLNILQQKIKALSKQSSEGSTVGSEQKNKSSQLKQPFYFVLTNTPNFQLSTIALKVNILQNRNAQLQTFQVFHHFHKQLFGISHLSVEKSISSSIPSN